MKLDVNAAYRIRTNNAFSLGRIATELRADKSAVSQWFTGKRGISLENALKLADLLSCTIGQLTGNEPYEPPKPLSPAEEDQKGASTVTIEESESGFLLKVTIELRAKSRQEAQSATLSEIVAFLSRILPNGKGLCIIGSAMGTAVIAVRKTAANEAVLADQALKEHFDELGVKNFSISEYIRIIGRPTSPAPQTNRLSESNEYEERRSEAAMKRIALREELEQNLLTSEEFSKAMQALKSEYADCWDDS